MGKHRLAFVAFDSAKDKHAVAIADDGRDGEVRYLGEIDNSPDAVRKLVAKLSRQYERLHFCYEAGPTGYGLHRQLTELGLLRCHCANDDSEALRRSGQDQPPTCSSAALDPAASVCVSGGAVPQRKNSHRLLTEYQSLRKRYWGQHLWSRGYWVASSGNVTDEVWKKYIEDQKPEEPDDNFKVV